MVVASLSAIGYFMPIFAFLLVFIVIYALLKNTKVLGTSEPVMLFVSLILASFFIVEVSLVEFVQFSSAWFSTLVIAVFFLVLILAFIPGIKIGEFLGKNNWFAWTLLVIMVVFFIFSSVYVWNWAINWGMFGSWFDSEWSGLILLVAIAGAVSFVLTKKA
jgi:hypothetical protein